MSLLDSRPQGDDRNLLWPTIPGSGAVSVSPKVNFPALDHAVLQFWEEQRVFLRSIEERPTEGKGDFVAYDGPPGTNGTPHIGHMMQSALKDLWPRYKTMQGYRVLRKAGWDTHGLPIELTAEKELGFKTKRDIEAYGVEKYIDYCRSTVFRYRDEWIKAIKRIGRFLDTDDDYATFRKEYIETDWWVLKQAWDKGLLYKDRRIMPYCSRCGTSLSQHEVAQGYKDVQDISIYAKFSVVGQENTFFVAWTTTPWTLLSNVALAVNPDLAYVKVEMVSGERYILAEARLESVKAMLGGYQILNHYRGSELEGMYYKPLWAFQSETEQTIHIVISDDYVTADDGTGIVHLALYGADDFRLIRANGLPMVQNIDLDGKCTPNTGQYAGRWFREEGLDVDILKDLASRGLLFGKEKITHSYPHCYRCDTPLMYFAKSGWFLRTSALKEEMLAANQKINWFPEHIKEGRFGNWLENNVDWNISRDRYWGSPIPIWECDSCHHKTLIESIKELEQHIGRSLPPNFDLHKPGIDDLEWDCLEHEVVTIGVNPIQGEPNYYDDIEEQAVACNGKMRRTPEVLDCWFNAGIMPWGQWSKETFGEDSAKGKIKDDVTKFPADFICEAIDQTRGWFYTMLATSVLVTTTKEKNTPLTSPPINKKAFTFRYSGGFSSFKNVICTEFITDPEGRKMSKSKGNVVDPIELCDKFGADAVRWTFYSVNPWTARRYKDDDLTEALKQVLIPYWNAYSFFVTYARVDGWKPILPPSPSPRAEGDSAANPLDRWILSRLVSLEETVRESLEGYNVLGAAQAFTTFLDDLTNWHIRRSRRRFWKSVDDDDKQLAYEALYQVLTTMNRILAPFLPFVSEVIYQNLERGYDPTLPDSVHLALWPKVDPALRDTGLENKMDVVRRVVSLARSLRADNNVRVRQPLREVAISGMSEEIGDEFVELILDELNIKNLRKTDDPNTLFSWRAKGDFKALGPKFGAKSKDAASLIGALTPEQTGALVKEGSISLGEFQFNREDVILSQDPVEGYWVRSEGGLTVAISNKPDEELTSEWLAREFIHHIQNMRKEAGLEVSDRIALEYWGDEELRRALIHHIRYVSGEILAESIVITLQSDAAEVRIGDRICRVKIRPLT